MFSQKQKPELYCYRFGYLLSCVLLLVTPWTVVCQVPLSMEFSRQEYWSRLPFPSPGDLPHPEIKPESPTLQADFVPSESQGKLKGKVKLLSRVRLLQPHGL